MASKYVCRTLARVSQVGYFPKIYFLFEKEVVIANLANI